MRTGPNIRRATAQDAPAIARIRIDAWRVTYRGLIPDAYLDGMQLDQSVALWDRVLTARANDTSVFVAEHDGEVVGFAAGNMLQEPRYDLNAELSAVYVGREFQRAGIGHRIDRPLTRRSVRRMIDRPLRCRGMQRYSNQDTEKPKETA